MLVSAMRRCDVVRCSPVQDIYSDLNVRSDLNVCPDLNVRPIPNVRSDLNVDEDIIRTARSRRHAFVSFVPGF